MSRISSPGLALRLFGPLQVLVDGEPMPRVRARSTEWLLALLTLRHGRTLDRAWLAGTLWPESEEGRALHNLRNALVALRKGLGPEGERLQSPSRDTLTFDLEGVEVDVVRFDAALKVGDEAALERAVALYSGPLLEGCYEAWVLPERESREQEALQALETLADRAAERQDHTAALRHLRQAEALDPLRETTARRLMTSLEAAGDPAAAMEVYRRLRQRLHETLSGAPDEATTRLFQEIRARARQRAGQKLHASLAAERAAPVHPATTTLHPSISRPPHPLAPLIGREQEVEEVRERLKQCRLVTLIGSGGVGKTRLAMEVAALAAGEFEGGAVWVELASLAEGALLLPTLAAALGIRQEGAGDAQILLTRLVTELSDSGSLLALDNCEHLLDDAAAVVQALLSRCSDLRVLATSRQRLGLAGELAWRVPSLPAPAVEQLPADPAQAPETAMTYPAVRLFVERAVSARSGFDLGSREEAEAVARICGRLDGIPLALELAAARIRTLTPSQIAERMDDRFRLLTSGARGALPRHQTLRALIDWSYEQLPGQERVLLRRLAVFAGGWTLEAAEAVCGSADAAEYGSVEVWEDGSEKVAPDPHTPIPPYSQTVVLDLLDSLVDRSLVLAEEQRGELRYRMLETVREYALERLRESKEEQIVRARHAGHYLALAEQAQPFLAKMEPAWLDRLEVEHDNLRAALTYFGAREERVEETVRLVAALCPFWTTRGHFYEPRPWLAGLALRPTPATKARSELLGWAAEMFAADRDSATARRLFTERLAICRRLGDREGIASVLNGLANLEQEPLAARALAEESLEIVRELDDRRGMAQSLFLLGHLARQAGNHAEARAHWMECQSLDEALGVKGGSVLFALGELALEHGDYATARRLIARFVAELTEIGDRWRAAWGILHLGRLAQLEGEVERAARLIGASFALRGSLAAQLWRDERASYESLRSALREALGEPAVAAAWAAGRAMTLEQAVTYALEEEAAVG